MPHEPFPDKTVVWDSGFLTRSGRSLAEQFFRTRAWDRWDDSEDAAFFLHATHIGHEHASQKWIQALDSEVPKPPPGFAQAYVNLNTAKSEASLYNALRLLQLGPNPLLDLEKLLKQLQTHMFLPPFAMEFRRSEAVAGRVNPQAFCAFCNEFCLHATREHVHAALIALDKLSLQVPSFSGRKKNHLFEQDPVQVILPSSLRELPQPSSEASSSARALSVPREDRSLTRFLEAHAWGLWKTPVQKQQLTVQQLATQTYC